MFWNVFGDEEMCVVRSGEGWKRGRWLIGGDVVDAGARKHPEGSLRTTWKLDCTAAGRLRTQWMRESRAGA
jgi:hypothetical protein